MTLRKSGVVALVATLLTFGFTACGDDDFDRPAPTQEPANVYPVGEWYSITDPQTLVTLRCHQVRNILQNEAQQYSIYTESCYQP